MEKLQIQNIGLPQYPIILYTEHCLYFSDNRALPQVLTCEKRIVMGKFEKPHSGQGQTREPPFLRFDSS